MTPEQRARRLYRSLLDQQAELVGYEAKYVELMARAFERALTEERETCAQIADERTAACRQAVGRYQHQYPAEPQWAASERCALREAEHIAERIRARSTDPAATSATGPSE